MKEHLLSISQTGYSSHAKTIDELTVVDQPQIEIPLEKQIEEIKKDPLLTAYIMSEYYKQPSKRMTYNQFVKLVNTCQRTENANK